MHVVVIKNKTSGSFFKTLLFVHGLITLAAAVVLIIAPAAIPGTIGIDISQDQYILCYFLAASELAIAFLSFFARSIDDKRSLRLIALSFIMFHLATAILEAYAASEGGNKKILINIIFRLLIAALFWYYGVYRNKT
jgi:hypothetical protein